MNTTIYILGILLQFIAAVIALLQVRRAPRKLPWLLIALSSLLIVARRTATIGQLMTAGQELAAAEVLTLVITLLFFLGVIFMSLMFNDVRESKIKIQNLLQEKEIILKETHHRVKNNMQAIYGLLSLQAKAQGGSDSAIIINDAAKRVQSMMVLYDKLYRSENIRETGVKAFLAPLIDEIIGLYPSVQPVRTEVRVEDFVMNAKTLSSIGIIINELLTNSLKYAFSGGRGGLITVTAFKKDDVVTILYGDDGVGLPEPVSGENSTGFGMLLIGNLLKQIHGTMTVSREKGTQFVFLIKT